MKCFTNLNKFYLKTKFNNLRNFSKVIPNIPKSNFIANNTKVRNIKNNN